MKKSKWRDKRTFGPIVRHEDDGSFRASCTWCVFRVGDACTHKSPVRRMDDPETTPEWCELREDMIKDAKEISITPKRLDR
jgi:hypothetical protein